MSHAVMPRGVPVPRAGECDAVPAMGELVLKTPSPAQLMAVRDEESLVWKGGLTAAEYLERCALTDKTDFGRATQAKWILVPAADPETLDVLASTESNDVPIWLKSDGRAPTEAKGLHVGRVLVVAKHRGRGLAHILSRLLLDSARERASDPASGIVLVYGHADPKLEPVYASHASFQRALDVAWSVTESICSIDDLPETRAITDANLSEVLALDDRLIRDELAAASSPGTQFAIRPTIGHYGMRYAGADYIFGKMRGGRTISTQRGVMIGDPSEPASCAFMLWIPCFAADSLTVLRVRASTPLQFRALAAAASFVAAYWSFKRVHLRGIDPALLAETSLVPVGGLSYTPSVASLVHPASPLHWYANERYCSTSIDF